MDCSVARRHELLPLVLTLEVHCFATSLTYQILHSLQSSTINNCLEIYIEILSVISVVIFPFSGCLV